MSGNIPSISNFPDSLSSQGYTTSESSGSRSSAGSITKNRSSSIGKIGKKISIPTSIVSKKISERPRAKSSSSQFETAQRSSHTISKVPTEVATSSANFSAQPKKTPTTLSPTSVAEAVVETILEPYAPLSCSSQELSRVTFSDYHHFFSNPNIKDDELLVFENIGLTTRSSESLMTSHENATPEEKKIAEEKNKIIADNNKAIKKDFSEKIRTEFGDHIADYFLLSALHQAYFQSEAPLTVGIIRSVITKANEAKAFVKNYTAEHLELPEDVAQLMGHGAFLEQEAQAAMKKLEELGLPQTILEEVRAHNAEFLKEAGINTAIVGGVSAAMLAGLAASFWMIPERLTTTVAASMAFSYSRAASATSSSSNNNAAVILTRAIPISIITPIQAAFLGAVYAHAYLLALPLAPLAIAAAASNYPMLPGQYVMSSLRDCKTPWDKSCATTAKLEQSNAHLEETTSLQKAATAAYKEALATQKNSELEKISKQVANAESYSAGSHVASEEIKIIKDAITQSRAQTAELDNKRVKSTPYSTFKGRGGRFKPQI